MSAELESLTDKQLRAKCLEYDLPNVPITDTSRKLLIRKLHTAIYGEPIGKSGSKNRRETIHVTNKISQETDKIGNKTTTSTKTSNRRTIATARDEPVPEPAKITNRRRSSRTTPVMQTKSEVTRNVPSMILEDVDEPFIYVDDEPAAQTASSIPIRKSRSPSLSKSVVVTTSYGKEQKVPEPIIEDAQEDDDDDIEFIPLSQKIVTTRYADTAVSPAQLLREREVIAASRYTQPPVRPVETKEFPVGYKSIYPSLGATTTSKYSYDTSNTSTRRYTTSGNPNPGAAPKTPTRLTQYAENSDDDNLDAHTPYLSDFARRLTRLKAEPLDIGIKRNEFASPTTATLSSGRYYGSRRNLQQTQSIGDSFRELLTALDRKYNLTRNFIILSVLLLITLLIYCYYF